MQNTNYVDRRIELMQSRIEEHKSIIGGFNAISELKNHAKQCVNEMNWFQRNFSSNSTVNKVNQIANLQDPFDTSTKTIDVVPSYCFWRDENGLNIKIDRSGQST
jgi:thiamine biosynthesis lipoprotein ApbE